MENILLEKMKKMPIKTSETSEANVEIMDEEEDVKEVNEKPKFDKNGIMIERSNFPVARLPTATSDSLTDSARAFARMIFPYSVEEFMTQIWERKAVVIKRKKFDFYKDLFSTKSMADIIERNPIQFGVNLDVTSWTKSEGRQTHNLPGRAYPAQVWDFYSNGCSVRMLNPQAYSATIYEQCAALQEFFGCFVGANAYLTPPGTQGFAPHYDDVEVFMLQVEGRKRWKVYNPFEGDELPRTSSRNYNPKEIKGEPAIYEILEPGDMIYMPRGWVHQGEALAGEHSLHVTISTNQKNAWADLLEQAVPAALKAAISSDVDFRRGLPTDYKLYMGMQNSDREDLDAERSAFAAQLAQLMGRMIDYVDIDKEVDAFANRDMHHQLPPRLTAEEAKRTVRGIRVPVDNGTVGASIIDVAESTEVRILRQQSVRVATNEERVFVYHNLDNPKLYMKEELKHFEVTAECAEIIEKLHVKYPKYARASDLMGKEGTMEETLLAIRMLLEHGVIMTKEPLKAISA